MTKERNAIMEKARAKKQRREEMKSAKTTTRKAAARSEAPASGLTEKVVGVVQQAAAHVGELAKAAAVKISGAAR
jgi:hypothetical protein